MYFYANFARICIVLWKKNTQLAQILHDRLSRRSWQISLLKIGLRMDQIGLKMNQKWPKNGRQIPGFWRDWGKPFNVENQHYLIIVWYIAMEQVATSEFLLKAIRFNIKTNTGNVEHLNFSVFLSLFRYSFPLSWNIKAPHIWLKSHWNTKYNPPFSQL